nr:PAS domain-containing protein [Myxococcota bacterium]
ERKRAESAAHAASLAADLARRRLEATLDALPTAVWIADADGRLVHMNAAVASIYGVAADARTIAEYGVYRARWESTGELVGTEEWALARTLLHGETIVAEPVEIERPDGTRRHVLNSSAPIRGADGRIEGGVAVMLDITERFDAARERERLIATLEFERKRLGMLLENAPAFIAAARGPDHVFELANGAYHALVGGRELVGRRVADALPEAEAQGFVKILDDVLRTGERFVGTAMPLTLMRGESTETRYLNFVYQPIVEADGTRSGVFALGNDVTDQVLVARRVRAQFEALPIPTLVFQRVTDPGGKPDFVFVDHNDEATRMTTGGIGPIGTRLSEFLPEGTPIVGDMLRALEESHVLQREVEYRFRGSGEARRFRATIGPLPPDLVVVFAEDITDRLALEEQLRQSQKMEAVGRLAGGVAHDFNNLLSVILSYTQFLLDDLDPTAPMREDLEQVHKAGERAAELTRQLLTFSRQQLIAPKPLRLRECVQSIERMLCRVLGEDVELSLSITDSRTVHADPSQLDLMLMNLAVNARDAMPKGGVITIHTADVELEGAAAERHGVSPGPYVLLSVSDTGLGMDAATKARVFEPFFTTKEVGKGTGLGLSTVFGIVRQSRGAISVESEPGAGTKFSIYLPAVEPGGVRDAPATEPPPAHGSETVLLVDDDDGVRGAARTILERAGYSVLEAETASDALLICEQHRGTIELLVSDVVMPAMSGPELAQRCGARRPEMRVLLVSGYAGHEMTGHDVADAFLQKPITPATLVRKVREVLDAPARR